jgi:hypothetical protein
MLDDRSFVNGYCPALKVRDGPFRSWFSEGHPGDEGTYRDGREVGRWKECNRFDKCSQVTTSLDLLHELPKLGLPQFCRAIDRNGEAFMLERKWGALATTVDIESASLVHGHAGQDVLRIRLNAYATALATEIGANEGTLRTRICLEHEQNAEFSRLDGITLLNYRLSDDAERAAQERKCIADRMGAVVIRLSPR